MQEYFKREIEYIKQQGRLFAKTYPDIAKALGMNVENYKDPQLNRLIESFAFLSASNKAKIDEKAARLPYQLLYSMHPKILYAPIESTILQFAQADKFIPKGTNLTGPNGIRLTLAHDITTSAAIVTHTIELGSTYGLNHDQVLVLKIANHNSDTIKLYIADDLSSGVNMYKALFKANCYKVDGSFSNVAIKPAHCDSTLYDIGQYACCRFDILHDFHTYPKHFMFVEISNLLVKQENVILVALSDKAALRHNTSVLLPNCATAVNLFEMDCIPIEHNAQHSNHLLYTGHENLKVHSPISCHGLNTEYKHFMLGSTSSWISYQKDQQHYLKLKNVPEQILIARANVYDTRVANLDLRESFSCKQAKAINIERFQMSDPLYLDDLQALFLLLFGIEHVNIMHAVKVYKYLEHIKRISFEEQCTYKLINNIMCPMPLLHATITSDGSGFGFMTAVMLGTTLERMSNINLSLSYTIIH